MRISDWSSDVCSSDLWAEKHGFGVSRRQVDAEIASIPAFQIGGRFDQASYEAALAQQNLSDRELRKGLTGDLLRRQVLMPVRSEEHTSELQSLMRISYAVFCLKKKNKKHTRTSTQR